jgi:hypothetical protein
MVPLEQYQTCCDKFGVIGDFQHEIREINGIFRRVQVIGTAKISIPFPNLEVVIDVKFDLSLKLPPVCSHWQK